MKALALLSIFLALPLAAQDAKVVELPTCSGGAPPPACPAVTDKNAIKDPSPLSAEEQVDLLIALTDYQGAWINRLQKLGEAKASTDDLKKSEEAGQAYMGKLNAAKEKHAAKDTPTSVWVWVFAQKKWVAQSVGGQ